MQIPAEQKAVDVDFVDFFDPVVFGTAVGTKRARVGHEGIQVMKASLRDNVLVISIRRGSQAFEDQHIVPFSNIKSMRAADARRPSTAPAPAPVEVKPAPRPVVSDVVKL